MKVLGILGAHKRQGLTGQLLTEILKAVPETEETEFLYLEDYDIKPHTNQPNPVLNELIQKLAESDVWVLAAPTYWGGLAGTMKNFLDCLRPKLVYQKKNGDTIPGPFKNKHYLSVTSCYKSTLENFITGVTDPTFKTIDTVMSAAGVIKVGELVLPNTFDMKTLPPAKIKLCHKWGQKIARKKRKDDSTVKRYIQLFFMIAVMALATMGIQVLLGRVLPLTNFLANYVSFVLIFFILLASILHYVTFVKHRRR
ncbi:flavodoxin family protein [Agrilactobacillus fermenti]|uniref:flavodoxin family protein n=1 Tax=Agrilactobacillus fermenti TaxID=2586909 RepID=UPI001E58C5E6|nr:flavodoxin family protein [Agrilactobacillus fermenti]MCD2255991.1 flavodoxin family protein [Agrilactobacillus fermenti]